MSAGVITSIASASTIPWPVRYLWPATTWERRHRRNATVILPSCRPLRRRGSNCTQRLYDLLSPDATPGDDREANRSQCILPPPQLRWNGVVLSHVGGDAEAVLGQQSADLIRREKAQPRFAALGCGGPDCLDVLIADLFSQFPRQHVVGDELGARRAVGQHSERAADCVAIEVHQDTKAADDCWLAEVEAGRAEAGPEPVGVQCLAVRRHGGKVGRNEDHAWRDRYLRSREGRSLPRLGGRVVHLKHSKVGCQRRSVAKGVQTGPEQDVLPHAIGRGGGDPVLCEPAPTDHLASGGREDGVRAVVAVVAQEFFGALAENGGRTRVGKDNRGLVDDQMSGSRCRRSHRAKAGLGWRHVAMLFTLSNSISKGE